MALLNNTPQEYYNGNDYGNYQFVSLADIIKQFMYVYVGEDKIISKASKTDVAFHAQRALAELSFDTLKSCKAQEYEVPATLQMPLPQDYVNYTKISFVDSAGIKHPLYPTKHTSNPSSNPRQDSNGNFLLQAVADLDPDMAASPTTGIELDSLGGDKEKLNLIMRGMKVTGPPGVFPDGLFVRNTLQTIGVDGQPYTYLFLENASGVQYIPPVLQAAILTFENPDGSLILPRKGFVVENLSWNTTDYRITATSAAALDDVEIGMTISNENWPAGTVVTYKDPYGTSVWILVSQLPTTAVASLGEVKFNSADPTDTTTWTNYKSATPSENNNDDYEDDTYWPLDGNRYGLEPSHAQTNGSFYIDCHYGKIHFSSNISGKTVILDYISDSLGTDEEMQVHKLAEEAMYRSILHAVASGLMQTQQLVPRLKKEKFAAVRTAKLRLSNLKLEELTQILRGKSKWIKH